MNIYFHPQKVGYYKTILPFLLNDVKHSIPITGDCVPIKLQLNNFKDKFVNFGEVLVGSIKKFKVNFYNDTSNKMEIHFNFYDNLIFHKRIVKNLSKTDIKMPVVPEPVVKELKKKKEDKKKGENPKEKQKTEKKNKKDKNKNVEKPLDDKPPDDSESLLKLKAEEDRKEFLSYFSITPSKVTLPPHGNGSIEISFASKKKISFEEQIYFEIEDHYEPFLLIKGSSIMPEFSLDLNELAFSGIIIGCSSSKEIKLSNTGDVTGSYSWTFDEKRTSVFNIEPKQGFVTPRNYAVFKVTFNPTKEKCEYRTKANCSIKDYKLPLKLLLKGNSVKMPDPIDTLSFTCNVRSRTEQPINITNNTFEQWLLKPEISNDQFSTAKEIIVPPQIETPINITFAPRAMTIPNDTFKGNVFIRLPDGSGLRYNLEGNATEPLVEKKIEREISCKKIHYEFLDVTNWLTNKQSFDVKTKLISHVTSHTLYRVSGFKTIQVEGKETKKYKWGIYLVNEGLIELKVTFKNPETGEFLFYEIGLKGLPCEPIQTMSFHTTVRKAVTRQLVLENLVNIPVTYYLECPGKGLTFENIVKMDPYTTSKIDVTYKPIIVENTSTTLTAKCEELGTFLYTIKMKSNPPEPNEDLFFEAELGEKATKTILFKNNFEQSLEFSYKFDDLEFYMERCQSISPGETGKIVIVFDPSNLATLESNLCLYSAISGEYIYKLVGEGLTPTPKGPFIVRSNYPAYIDFRNSFNDDKVFVYDIHPEIFVADLSEELIKARKTSRITIKANSNEETEEPVAGKLVIYLSDDPKIKWSYYLHFKR